MLYLYFMNFLFRNPILDLDCDIDISDKIRPNFFTYKRGMYEKMKIVREYFTY